jgi:signal transduction histidine kinase
MRGEQVRGEELRYQRADGTSVWVRISAAPVRDADGVTLGGIVAFYDIDQERAIKTENARLYEEARRANQAKDDFFAAVSHELRTPMTAIIGWSRLLREEQLDNPDAIEATDAIASSAALQAQLVDDLLDVSRINTGKLTLHLEPLDIREIVDNSVRNARPVAESKSIRLRAEVDIQGSIEADRGRIKQIIGNLLSNAVKFTPAGGLIEVVARDAGGSAVIIVRDTGRGIDPEILPYVFDRYRQASGGEMGGLGLGLTIVRHLVELHGGEIVATSEGAGKGATFTVRLPLLVRDERE